MTIKVLIVDDSALMRALLAEIISGAADLEVVGAAPDPIAAREMIKALNPDVLTLDVEMPRMDGLEFLDRLMRLRPMPVIMISSFTAAGSEVTLRALELGAVDYLAKPQAGNLAVLQAYADDIRDKIRAAAGAKLKAAPRIAAAPAPTPAPAAGNFSQRLLNETVIGACSTMAMARALRSMLATPSAANSTVCALPCRGLVYTTIAARMAMIMSTVSSSTRVKAVLIAAPYGSSVRVCCPG